MGLVLMDDIFELDGSLAIGLKAFKLKIEVKKFLVLAFLIICVVSIILELVQFILSQRNASFLDPMVIIGGSFLGIIIHIIGSKLLMKRVEFELERWEDNVL
jgi:VanZ family protein